MTGSEGKYDRVAPPLPRDRGGTASRAEREKAAPADREGVLGPSRIVERVQEAVREVTVCLLALRAIRRRDCRPNYAGDPKLSRGTMSLSHGASTLYGRALFFHGCRIQCSLSARGILTGSGSDVGPRWTQAVAFAGGGSRARPSTAIVPCHKDRRGSTGSPASSNSTVW